MTEKMIKPRTTSWEMSRRDLRLARAQSLCAALMHAIQPHIDVRGETSMRNVSNAILELLHSDGIEVLTDYNRQEIGLPPRDEVGWTAEDIRAYDRRLKR